MILDNRQRWLPENPSFTNIREIASIARTWHDHDQEASTMSIAFQLNTQVLFCTSRLFQLHVHILARTLMRTGSSLTSACPLLT
jgi:hypothetical protein